MAGHIHLPVGDYIRSDQGGPHPYSFAKEQKPNYRPQPGDQGRTR
ncbi:MAG: hypothetical protein V1862_08995 [Methanobacteriota archaeon]